MSPPPLPCPCRSLLNEISILERRLQELRHSGPGGAGTQGEEEAAAARRWGGGTGSGTGPRGQMKRDREVHRLGLRGVADMPREVLSSIVQVS